MDTAHAARSTSVEWLLCVRYRSVSACVSVNIYLLTGHTKANSAHTTQVRNTRAEQTRATVRHARSKIEDSTKHDEHGHKCTGFTIKTNRTLIRARGQGRQQCHQRGSAKGIGYHHQNWADRTNICTGFSQHARSGMPPRLLPPPHRTFIGALESPIERVPARTARAIAGLSAPTPFMLQATLQNSHTHFEL